MSCPKYRCKGSGYTKPDTKDTTNTKLVEDMKRKLDERAKQDASVFRQETKHPSSLQTHTMDVHDIEFLTFEAYSFRWKKVVSEMERAVWFQDGVPIWDHMAKVADALLFQLDIPLHHVQPKEAHTPTDGIWIPYTFTHVEYGECCIRVGCPPKYYSIVVG